MAGIEDLKLFRTEPFRSTFQEFYDKPGLEWKTPFQGRWFSSTPYYSWLGPDTIMKELETKFPFTFADEAGQIETRGKGFTTKGMKTATDLAKDQELLRDWLPVGEGAGPVHQDKRLEVEPRFTSRAAREEWEKWNRDFWKKYPHAGGKYGDNPAVNYRDWLKAENKLAEFRIPMTKFEADARYNIAQGKAPSSVMTPPLDIANQAKVNLWESFKQNFMGVDRPQHSIDWLKEKGIHYPKSRLENIKRIPHKISDIWGRYKAGQPIKSGIPWSTIGRSILNNPVTRTVGGLGNVALGGQALLDIGTGSQHTKNMMTDINRFAGVPVDRQGNVIQSNRVYENLQNVAQRDVLNPNEMRGVTSFDTTRYNPREMNTGGIASLR